jgi:Ca2+-binding RTX toxin-like protein
MARIRGTSGDDTIAGTAENDTIVSGLGVDDVFAGDGDDEVHSNDQDGVLDGGAGIDRVRVLRSDSSTAFSIDFTDPNLSNGTGITLVDGTVLKNFERLFAVGGAGNDTFIGGELGDVLNGGAGADFLSGGGGGDQLIGGVGDTMLGGEGNDQFFLDSAPDIMDGGAGTDHAFIRASMSFDDSTSVSGIDLFRVNSGLTVDFSELTQWIRMQVEQVDTAGVNIIGTDFGDFIRGGSGNDTINSGRGNDTVNGGDGADQIQGWGGDDVLNGGAGDDRLFSNRTDHGRDTVDGGDGIDFADIDREKLSVDLILDIEAGPQDLADGSRVLNIEQLKFEGGSGNDVAKGGALYDNLIGNEGDDLLVGRGGDDRLFGGAGDDTLDGGDGFDTAHYEPSYVDDDVLVEHLGGTNYRITIGDDVDLLTDVERVNFGSKAYLIGSLVD